MTKFTGPTKRLKSALQIAIETRDLDTIRGVVDRMRFRFGMNYRETFDMVSRLTGVDEPTWDQLLADIDSLESCR